MLGSLYLQALLGNQIMDDTMPKCTLCDNPFTDEEWDDRHWPHSPECEAMTIEDSPATCRCDNEVHAICCFNIGCFQCYISNAIKDK